MDRETFEHLKPEEQEEIFHKTPFRERGELLHYARLPAQLTQSLSQEELYLMTREMDLEEKSEVLRYASLPQLFFISDIDCWKKDRLHAKSFVKWLEILLAADEERLLAWLVEMDYETVVTGFKALIRVLKPEWEYAPDEVLGDETYFTLDECYFISVREENIETVRRAIEVLFENARGRYAAILEGVMGELDYEMEEEAFQKRGSRLADRGFPDLETAHLIYRPLSWEEFERFPLKNQTKSGSAGIDEKFQGRGTARRAPTSYPALASKEKLLLDEVLLLFREEPAEVREGLEEELAWLSNKVIACDGVDFASEERVRHGIERSRRLVSLGLEALSGRDLSRAKDILRERWLETIFRWGVTQLFSLREEAASILEAYWKGNRKSFLEFLDSPYETIFQGLFRPLPECFDPSLTQQPDLLRDFKEMKEVGRTRQAIRQLEAIFRFMARELSFTNPHPEGTLFSFLGTAFASFVLQDRLSSRPLSSKEIGAFLQKAFEARGSSRALKDEWKEKFLNRFFRESERELLKPFWALVFDRMEEDVGTLDPSRPVDSRFIASLLIND